MADRGDDDVSRSGNRDAAKQEKLEVLIEMICRARNEPAIKSAALLVLVASLENASHPKLVANTAKHLVFTRCDEMNTFGIVDAQIRILERELFSSDAAIG